MNYADRIVTMLEHFALTQRAFADSISISYSYMHKMVHGRSSPGGDVLQKISETYPKVNTRWLLTGEGTAFSEGREELNVAFERLPHRVVTAKAQAGVMSPYFEEEWKQECEAVKLPGINSEAYILDIVGDSMEPLFYEGTDRAVVVPMEDARELTANRLVACVTGGSGVFIKVLRAHRMDGGVRLGSLNQSYEDIILSGSDYFKLYIVVAKWTRRFDMDGMPSKESPELVEMREMMARLKDKFPEL